MAIPGALTFRCLQMCQRYLEHPFGRAQAWLLSLHCPCILCYLNVLRHCASNSISRSSHTLLIYWDMQEGTTISSFIAANKWIGRHSVW